MTRYSYTGAGSLWNGSVWEINNGLEAITQVSCCKLEDKPNDICVASGCAEGQYWCQSENTCKAAGQACNTITCNNNNTCETGESCNCADCTNGGTDDKDKCGFASTGAQMVCTKDVKNTTTSTSPLPTTEKWVAYTGPYHIYIAKIPADAHTLSGKTFYIYNPEKIIPLASMSKTAFLANPTEAIKNAPTIPIGTTALASRNIFNLAQLQSESQTIQDTTIQNITNIIYYRYLCRESKA